MPKADKKRRAELSELNEEVAKHAVDAALDDLIAAFSDVAAGAPTTSPPPAATSPATSACSSMSGEEEQNAIVRQTVDTARDARFRRYLVNVMVSNGERRARAAHRSSRSSTPPTATSSAASSTSPRWARSSPISC